jgi:pimeloyl-ACP methyl ester carboxylesterase
MSVTPVVEEVVVRDIPLAVKIIGQGAPLVVLHGLVGSHVTAGLQALATDRTVVLPEHPGFGESPQVPSLRSVGDLAVLHLDLLDQLGYADAPILGQSFGGWIAAEMATRAHLSKLLLVDPMGCRIDGEPRDDVFYRPRDVVLDLVYADRSVAPTDGSSFADARNLNALAHYGWNPYLCDLGLLGRLHRIATPTAIVWGTDDRVVPVSHAELFAGEIPGSTVTLVEGAGHDPSSDQPERFAAIVREFLAQDRTDLR